MSIGRDLQIALFDIALQLIQPRHPSMRLPRWDSAVKDIVHLLERFSLCLRRCEEHLSHISIWDILTPYAVKRGNVDYLHG